MSPNSKIVSLWQQGKDLHNERGIMMRDLTERQEQVDTMQEERNAPTRLVNKQQKK